ncbi:MAG TPA: hypothetical protein VFC78_02915 [Tepidisphaeraceae bacterium]|nr:hypothetical protein [Tepidisphaeraceae bacterium]
MDRTNASLDYRVPIPETINIGAEIWFMTIVGLLLIFFGRDIVRYEFARITHGTYHTNVNWTRGDKEGQEVRYPDLTDMSGLQGGTMYTDICLFLFGLTMIVDGVGRALAARRLPGWRSILWFTLGITLLTVAFNFFVAAKYVAAGSLPIVSGLAIAFGGYLAFFQWAMLRAMRPAAR